MWEHLKSKCFENCSFETNLFDNLYITSITHNKLGSKTKFNYPQRPVPSKAKKSYALPEDGVGCWLGSSSHRPLATQLQGSATEKFGIGAGACQNFWQHVRPP
jgi:hypothetical protein